MVQDIDYEHLRDTENATQDKPIGKHLGQAVSQNQEPWGNYHVQEYSLYKSSGADGTMINETIYILT